MTKHENVDLGSITEPEKTDEERIVCSTPFLKMVERNGWSFVSRPNATAVAAIVALTPERELVLTEQYRQPLGRRVIDLPAGLSDANESSSVVETAARELEEETGFIAQSYRKLFERPTSPGLTDEIVTFVQAEGLVRLHHGGGLAEEGEAITVHLISLNEIDAWLEQRQAQGVFVDPKVDVALRTIGK